MENAIKIIEAIGKQWPFLLTVFLIIIFILKWKTIWSFLANFTQIKIRRGDNEIEINKTEPDEKKETLKEESANQVKEKPLDTTEQAKDTNTDIQGSYYKAIFDKDFKTAKSLFSKIMEDEKDETIRYEKKLNNFYMRYLNGDTTSFGELENYLLTIENNDEHKSHALFYLGLLYSEGGNNSKATELLNNALSIAQTDTRKAACITNLSEIYGKMGDENNSLGIILRNLNQINDRDSSITLYRSLANYYEKKNNTFLKSLAYQKALELKPNDTNLIFDVAYNYSDIATGFKDIGLLMYKKLLRFDSEHKGALNNVGVAYKNLDFNIKSVDSYKESIKLGNSLAAANLAYLLIEFGFKTEAEEYLKRGQEQKNIHDNIFSAASTLKQKIKTEEENEKKVIEKAERKYLFLNNFGNALFKNERIKIDTSKNWTLKDKTISFILENDNVFIAWEIGEEKHEIKGTINNNALFLTYKYPKRNYYSYGSENKYTYTDHNGYGYINSPESICFYFEIEKESIELTLKS